MSSSRLDSCILFDSKYRWRRLPLSFYANSPPPHPVFLPSLCLLSSFHLSFHWLPHSLCPFVSTETLLILSSCKLCDKNSLISIQRHSKEDGERKTDSKMRRESDKGGRKWMLKKESEGGSGRKNSISIYSLVTLVLPISERWGILTRGPVVRDHHPVSFISEWPHDDQNKSSPPPLLRWWSLFLCSCLFFFGILFPLVVYVMKERRKNAGEKTGWEGISVSCKGSFLPLKLSLKSFFLSLFMMILLLQDYVWVSLHVSLFCCSILISPAWHIDNKKRMNIHTCWKRNVRFLPLSSNLPRGNRHCIPISLSHFSVRAPVRIDQRIVSVYRFFGRFLLSSLSLWHRHCYLSSTLFWGFLSHFFEKREREIIMIVVIIVVPLSTTM